MIRSMLFVPGDSERKFAKAIAGEADSLILDLEDSVSDANKPQARAQVAGMLAAPRRQKIFVRINAYDTGLATADLAAVMPAHPDGIVLPKCSGAEAIRRLAWQLDVCESYAAVGTRTAPTTILPIVSETADSIRVLATESFRDLTPRLWGLMWGAEDLAADLGASENHADGVYHSPYLLARTLCLAAAAAAGLVAVDAVIADIRNHDRVGAEARAACRDGFGAKAVIHPDHVPIVHTAFAPSQDEVQWARDVVRTFRDSATTGVASLNGRMLDRPHLRQAERVLGRAAADTNFAVEKG